MGDHGAKKAPKKSAGRNKENNLPFKHPTVSPYGPYVPSSEAASYRKHTASNLSKVLPQPRITQHSRAVLATRTERNTPSNDDHQMAVGIEERLAAMQWRLEELENDCGELMVVATENLKKAESGSISDGNADDSETTSSSKYGHADMDMAILREMMDRVHAAGDVESLADRLVTELSKRADLLRQTSRKLDTTIRDEMRRIDSIVKGKPGGAGSVEEAEAMRATRMKMFNSVEAMRSEMTKVMDLNTQGSLTTNQVLSRIRIFEGDIESLQKKVQSQKGKDEEARPQMQEGDSQSNYATNTQVFKEVNARVKSHETDIQQLEKVVQMIAAVNNQHIQEISSSGNPEASVKSRSAPSGSAAPMSGSVQLVSNSEHAQLRALLSDDPMPKTTNFGKCGKCSCEKCKKTKSKVTDLKKRVAELELALQAERALTKSASTSVGPERSGALSRVDECSSMGSVASALAASEPAVATVSDLKDTLLIDDHEKLKSDLAEGSEINRVSLPTPLCSSSPLGSTIKAIDVNRDRPNEFVTVDSGGGVHTWQVGVDSQTVVPLRSFIGHKEAVNDVAYQPQGPLIASVSDDNRIMFWDTSPVQNAPLTIVNTLPINSCTFTADGNGLFCGCYKVIKLFDIATGTQKMSLSGHQLNVYATRRASLKGPPMLVSCGDDNMVKLWDLDSGRCVDTFNGHQSWVWDAIVSPDGLHIASASQDKTVKVRDTRVLGKVLYDFKQREAVYSLCHAGEGILMTGSRDGRVRLYDVLRGTFVGATGPDAAGGLDKHARVMMWDGEEPQNSFHNVEDAGTDSLGSWNVTTTLPSIE